MLDKELHRRYLAGTVGPRTGARSPRQDTAARRRILAALTEGKATVAQLLPEAVLPEAVPPGESRSTSGSSCSPPPTPSPWWLPSTAIAAPWKRSSSTGCR